jgi:RES domain-containing protein
MRTLPAALGGGTELIVWRLDRTKHKDGWRSGEGPRVAGARWNSAGTPVVYCSLDPATTILEKAVHVGFAALDQVPHVLTSVRVADPQAVHVVPPADVPNPNWLRPGSPSAGQQNFGDALLAAHVFVLIPSVVSTRSWNLLFDPGRAAGAFALVAQEAFALDTRLHRPAKTR